MRWCLTSGQDAGHALSIQLYLYKTLCLLFSSNAKQDRQTHVIMVILTHCKVALSF